MVMVRGHLTAIGTCPGGPVLIGLAPGAEQLAHRLLAQYGRNVAITVGLTTYNGTPGRSPSCGRVPAPSPLPVGLHLALRLKQQVVRSGAIFNGTVIVRERGRATSPWTPGSLSKPSWCAPVRARWSACTAERSAVRATARTSHRGSPQRSRSSAAPHAATVGLGRRSRRAATKSSSEWLPRHCLTLRPS